MAFLSTPSGWRATHLRSHIYTRCYAFLSTPSGWRATYNRLNERQKACNFYPRPPGGGRHFILIQKLRYYFISIHALRVEGDLPRPFFDACKNQFLSTPSGWRATCTLNANCPGDDISIHALRVEGDKLSRYAVWCAQ